MSDLPLDASIYQRLAAILAELPAIGKTQRNAQQGFNFRGIDDVLNALNPLLGKYGVFAVPEVLERISDERTTRNGGVMYVTNLHVRYTFYGPAGDSVSGTAWGEGTDSGDKATPKAMTGAMKQVLFQTFAINTEEMANQDSDHHTPDETVGGRTARQRRAATGTARPSDPATSDLRQQIAIQAQKLDLDDNQRHHLVSIVTNGRTATSTEITVEEAMLVLKLLTGIKGGHVSPDGEPVTDRGRQVFADNRLGS